jgi:hypothetical protein
MLSPRLKFVLGVLASSSLAVVFGGNPWGP